VKAFFLYLAVVLLVFSGCGGGGDSSSDGTSKVDNKTLSTGIFQDVSNLSYKTSSSIVGKTDQDGKFNYKDGDTIEFYYDNMVLGNIKAQESVDISNFKNPGLVAQTLHALDSDGDFENGISLPKDRDSRSFKVNRSDIDINLDLITEYDEDYIDFLHSHGNLLESKTTSLLVEMAKYLNTSKTVQKKNSYVELIINGTNLLPPADRYKDDSYIRTYIQTTSDTPYSFEYKVSQVALYSMMLESQKAQVEDSNKMLSNQDLFEKEVDVLQKSAMYSINSAIDATDVKNVNVKAENIAKILKGLSAHSKDTIDYAIDNAMPEDMQLDSKLATTIMYDCVGNSNKTGCAIGVIDNRLSKIIEEKLKDQYPMSAIWANGIKDIMVNNTKVYLACKSPKNSSEINSCVKEIANATLGKVFDLSATISKSYNLGKEEEVVNSKSIAYEIFFTSKYLEKNIDFSVKDPDYCTLVDYYSGDKSKCKTKDKSEQFEYLIEKVIDKNVIDELIPGFFSTSYDEKIIKDTLSFLEKRYDTLYSDYKKSLKDYSNEQENIGWLYNQVNILSPEVAILTKTENSIDMQVCFNVSNWRTVANAKASIALITKSGDKVELPLESYNSSWRGSNKICSQIYTYQGDIDKDTLLFINKLEFNFNLGNSIFEVKNFNFYEYSREVDEDPLPTVDFTVSYDKKLKSYYLKSSLMQDKDIDSYIYYWDISGSSDCSYEKSNSDGYLFYGNANLDPDKSFDEECFSVSHLAKLIVRDKDGNFIGKYQKVLDPITTSKPENLSIVSTPSILDIKASKSKVIKLKVDGGLPPYTITATNSNDFFTVKKLNQNIYKIVSSGVSDKSEIATITFHISDQSGDSSSTQVKVSQLAQKVDQPLTISTNLKDYKKPYSFYPNKAATVEPNSSFEQVWWLQNSSLKSLKDVTLKLSPYCDSTLTHARGDIYLGDMAVNEIKRPTLAISGGVDGDESYCQWDIFAKDENGKDVRLLWNNSKRAASVNYWIESKTTKDLRPPFITYKNGYYQDGIVHGEFQVEHPSGEVKHLRVYFSKDRLFLDKSNYIDIGADYQDLQSTGLKSFNFPIDNWPSSSFYFKVEVTNKDNVGLVDDVIEGVHLIGYKYQEPEVVSLEPLTATVNKNTLFTLTGKNLPTSLAMSLDGAICSPVTIISNEKATIKCLSKKEGKKRFYVALKKGGEGVKGQDSLYVNVTNVSTEDEDDISLKDLIYGKTLYQYCQNIDNYKSLTFDKDYTLHVSYDKYSDDLSYTIDNNEITYKNSANQKLKQYMTDFSDTYVQIGNSIENRFFFSQNSAKDAPINCKVEDLGDGDGGDIEDDPTLKELDKVNLHPLNTKANANYAVLSWSGVVSPSDDRAVYEIEIADNSQFSNSYIINAGSNRSYRVENLEYDKKYFFRVRAKNSKSVGTWSDMTWISLYSLHKPKFDLTFQRPADKSYFDGDNPRFAWKVIDEDDDKLEYYVEFGLSKDSLYYNSGWISDDRITYKDITSKELKPNRTYYWRVLVREEGKDKAYYGGEYISSPIWSFTTSTAGYDLSIEDIKLLDDIKPNSDVRVEVKIKNLGTKKIDDFYAQLKFKKGDKINDFATKPMKLYKVSLDPQTSTTIELTAVFSDKIITKYGNVYDNVIEEGVKSALVVELPYTQDQDLNPSDNKKEYEFTYISKDLPVIKYFSVGPQSFYEEGKLYTNLGKNIGRLSGIIFDIEDDLKVTKVTIEYQIHDGDSWNLIKTYINDDDFITKEFNWIVPDDDTFVTDEMRIRLRAYEDDNHFSEIVSHKFSVYDNNLLLDVDNIDTHKIGDKFDLDLSVSASAGSLVRLIEIKLISNGHSEVVYQKVNNDGFELSLPITINIPNENIFASDSAKLIVRIEDTHGNSKIVEKEFKLNANIEVDDIFSNVIDIYNKQYDQFPADSSNQSTENDIYKIILDDENRVHILVRSIAWWRNSGQNSMSRDFRYYYITYDYDTKAKSEAKLLYSIKQINSGSLPDEQVRDFIITEDNQPYVLIYNSNTKEISFYTSSGKLSLSYQGEESEIMDSFSLFNHEGDLYLKYRSILDGKKIVKVANISKRELAHDVGSDYYGSVVRVHDDKVYFPFYAKAFSIDDEINVKDSYFDFGKQDKTIMGDVKSYNSMIFDFKYENGSLALINSDKSIKKLVEISDDAYLKSTGYFTKVDAAIFDDSLIYVYSYQPDPDKGRYSYKLRYLSLDGDLLAEVNLGNKISQSDVPYLISINKNKIVAAANIDKGSAYLTVGDFSK